MINHSHCFRSRSRRAGFSLVEMIGVLAIIAILAVVIVPKVFSTIASSRITAAMGTVTSMKSALTDYAGKYGTIPLSDVQSRIDDLLVTAGMLDTRFAVKLGTPAPNPAPVGDVWTLGTGGYTLGGGGVTQVAETRLISLNSVAAAVAIPAGTYYRLDGATALPTNSRVVSAVIRGVTPNEARELSVRLDGEALSQPDTTTADLDGKVTYNGTGATRNVFIYIAHQ